MTLYTTTALLARFWRRTRDRVASSSQLQRYFLLQGLGLLMLVLCFVWFLDYKGGVGWTENPGKEFNWHPILMSLGLVFLYGQGKFVPSYVIRDADSW